MSTFSSRTISSLRVITWHEWRFSHWLQWDYSWPICSQALLYLIVSRPTAGQNGRGAHANWNLAYCWGGHNFLFLSFFLLFMYYDPCCHSSHTFPSCTFSQKAEGCFRGQLLQKCWQKIECWEPYQPVVARLDGNLPLYSIAPVFTWLEWSSSLPASHVFSVVKCCRIAAFSFLSPKVFHWWKTC